MSIVETLRIKFEALIPYLDEKLRRLWAASEAVALGKGGIKTVAFATGISPNRIRTRIKELGNPFKSQSGELVSDPSLVNFNSKETFAVRRFLWGKKKANRN